MKILGIVGGIGPASTIDYYRLLQDAWRASRPDGSYPPLLINSIDLGRLLGLVGAGRLDELAGWLGAEVERLARAGADLALLASNTPHIVFDRVAARSPIPLVSIVEAAAQAVAAAGFARVGLLGTRSTMEGAFYPAAFAARGLAVLAPDTDDRAWVHEKYLGELVPGDFRPETREGLLRVIGRLREAGADAILLAGTELPLILRDAASPLPLIDTAAVHVRRAAALAWGSA